jgi:hypothetical protein
MCFFNKSCSCLCDRGHECIIYMILKHFVVKMYLCLKCNVKGGTQNANFKVINKYNNDMRYV